MAAKVCLHLASSLPLSLAGLVVAFRAKDGARTVVTEIVLTVGATVVRDFSPSWQPGI